ncbi:unnamed protein product [Litomosoides sigmodontis]|uniref:Uncharacterized protein n=1 Tax=Litomosoides sigmodontis TaxID=42156 RepID=A0A3P6SQW2_LITSI|nr:unnamed protein product [Litomosoides sigmodontis]
MKEFFYNFFKTNAVELNDGEREKKRKELKRIRIITIQEDSIGKCGVRWASIMCDTPKLRHQLCESA